MLSGKSTGITISRCCEETMICVRNDTLCQVGSRTVRPPQPCSFEGNFEEKSSGLDLAKLQTEASTSALAVQFAAYQSPNRAADTSQTQA